MCELRTCFCQSVEGGTLPSLNNPSGAQLNTAYHPARIHTKRSSFAFVLPQQTWKCTGMVRHFAQIFLAGQGPHACFLSDGLHSCSSFLCLDWRFGALNPSCEGSIPVVKANGKVPHGVQTKTKPIGGKLRRPSGFGHLEVFSAAWCVFP